MRETPNDATLAKAETRARARRALMSTLVVGFFVGILVFFCHRLYEETREKIVKEGELSVRAPAERLGESLSKCSNMVRALTMTLNGMLAEKRTDAEMQAQIAKQSKAITNGFFTDSPGMYAYVNGKYFNGAWAPGPDYAPTSRPWYVQAMAGGGELTIVEPYLDQRTQQVVMTFAQRLKDGKSVAAMDMYTSGLQKVVDAAVADGEATHAFIVTPKGTVVAHSNHGEIGHNYAHDHGSLWGQFVAKARQSEAVPLELTYKGVDYLAFVDRVGEGWLCLCVKDASRVLRPLRLLLAFSAALVVACAIVLLSILHKSERRYRMADRLNKQLSSLANVNIAVYDIDLENDSYSTIKGYAPIEEIKETHPGAQAMLEAMTTHFGDAAALNDLRRFFDVATLRERLKATETIAMEFLTTEKKWVRARFVVARRGADGAPGHVLLLAEDIDKEKKERDQLRDISERAVAASEAKSSFLSNMSHEIRTPINAILGMNEMILRESREDGTLAYAENIHSAGNTLLGLINDILDFSKIEAGKIEIIPGEYSLASLLNDLVAIIQTRARAKGLALELVCDPETPSRLLGDEIRIKQVITNILSNAVKYTEKGKVTLRVGFQRLPDDPEAVSLQVAVRDTGIGIKPEDIERLFTEFERVDEKRNRAIEGTGLGMAITKSLLDLMGTTLQVESEYGAGSTFAFALRQKVVAWEPLGDFQPTAETFLKEREAYHEKFTAPDARVLVADDNPMNLVVFQNLLKQTQVQIDTANDGDEALELAQGTAYDLLFLDHMMPGKDGIETLRALRASANALNGQTPAICLTANAIAGARDQYIAAGFVDYLTKPVDAGKLEATLQAHLPKNKIKVAGAKQAAPTDGMTIAALIAKLRGQDWIDLSLGLQNSGSAKAYLPLLKIFYETMDERAQEIEGFRASGDLKNYAIKVHALKSSARLIGAAAFAEEAQRLEDAGKREDWDYVRAHHPAFMAKLRGFKAPLGEVLAQKVDDKPEAAPDMMVDVYAAIRAAAAEMDSDRLDAVFAEMADYRVPDDGTGLWERVKEAAGRFDYEAIEKLLADK
ncbi:MAG: response regulator [Planctomycetes bacterium]|nr:response regulator [Planctomycetota bacterium]